MTLKTGFVLQGDMFKKYIYILKALKVYFGPYISIQENTCVRFL